jgi:hypothetical protein
MNSNEEKIAKIEMMLYSENSFKSPGHPRFQPVIPVSGSQRLEIIHKIMEGRA